MDDGALNSFSVPVGTDWISFQWASSNFLENYSTVDQGTNDSGGLGIIGLLSYSSAPGPRLLISPCTPVAMIEGTTQQLRARYWDSFSGAPTCADSGYTDVTNISAWTTGDGSKVSVSAGGMISGLVQTAGVPVEIKAAYNSLEASVSVNVVSSATSCSYAHCDSATGYQCVIKTVGTFPCSQMANCSDAVTPESCLNKRHWQEVAP
jgi:hypothetical protein